MFSPFSPVDIRILDQTQGLEAVEELLQGTSGLCVLASASMGARLSLAPFLAQLTARHHRVWLQKIPANPSVTDVSDALNALEGKPLGAVLAVGGGSAIDLGKAIAALHGLNPGSPWTAQSVREAISQKKYQRRPSYPALIALPTTAGTGSEVTPWATVWDPEKKQKLSVEDTGLFPRAAVIVPAFTAFMGPELTLATGLDALSHAMEAFWAKRRTPLSQELALAAIQKIRRCLPEAAKPEHAANMALRQEMCVGAVLAGLAFSITRTTACHAISYPLTMLYHVPHGFAAAMTLNSVLGRNQGAVPEIQNIQAIFAEDGGLGKWIDRTASPVRPLRLSSFGIEKENLPMLAALCFTAGRMDNNPVAFTEQDVLAILAECL